MTRRFVILEHDHPFLHWDFLLESGDVLTSFRLLAFPKARVWIDSEPLPDHRMLYLDYEGEVSGDRGSVKRIHSGRYGLVQDTNGAGTHYELSGCELGSKAVCRLADDGLLQWWFE